ncbi:MAG: hypothetical protein ACR2HX_00210 [Pyrinomonadaceae bacterium]
MRDRNFFIAFLLTVLRLFTVLKVPNVALLRPGDNFSVRQLLVRRALVPVRCKHLDCM